MSRVLKLKIFAGKATSGPPLGPTLGQFKVSIIEFCKDFNEKTQHLSSDILLSVRIILFNDFSYMYYVTFPSTYLLLKWILQLEKGNGFPGMYLINVDSALVETLSSTYGIITPQLIYELALFLSSYSHSSISLRSYFNILVSSIYSSGIHILSKRKRI